AVEKTGRRASIATFYCKFD
ncbi:unnamed protein product, partial [Oikopleura dioica]